MQGVRIRSLVGELRSHMPHGAAENTNKQITHLEVVLAGLLDSSRTAVMMAQPATVAPLPDQQTPSLIWLAVCSGQRDEG